MPRHLVLSLCLLATVYIVWRIILRRVATYFKADKAAALSWQYGVRNTIAVVTVILLAILWGSEVRSLTLSLAALGAAGAIVFKEVLLNFQGAAIRSVTRPFSMGDRVELNGQMGCVIGMTFMSTKLLVVGPGERATGSTITIPNAQLITGTVTNHSATGKYRLVSVPVPLDPEDSIDEQEQRYLQIAKDWAAGWLEEAHTHFTRIGHELMVDLPSVEPRLLLVYNKDGELEGLLQAPIPGESRVTAEQALLRALYKKDAAARPVTCQEAST